MLDRGVRRAEMERIAAWGIAGIKVDFFDSDKQDRIQQYLDILRDAADFELLVNFHGATLPRGWQRTYPHLMTHEAVNGVEYYMGPTGPDAANHVHYVFIRNVVGSMDYTPVAFESALAKQELTYAHSLALSVLFESGLQHFAGRADGASDSGYAAVFADSPFVEEFLSDVPVAWDDTRLLSGHPDTHAVLARRSGATWYVAGIRAAWPDGGGGDADLAIALDFLSGDGPHDVRCITVGDTPDALALEEQTLGPDDELTMALVPDDGFACTLRPRR
jgi:hypothetical protein